MAFVTSSLILSNRCGSTSVFGHPTLSNPYTVSIIRRPRSYRRRTALQIQSVATSDAPYATATEGTWPDASDISRSFSFVPSDGGDSGAMDIEGIMAILPHRFPFLLVDRVLHLEPGVRAIGVKNVSVNEPYFPGHFPARPIMPGVLQVEALAQLAGIAMLDPKVKDFFFGGVESVRWRKPVVPGDTLVMEVEVKSFKKKFGIAKVQAKGFVAGKLAVEGLLTLVMVVDK